MMIKKFLVAVSVDTNDIKFINFQNYFNKNIQAAAKEKYEINVDYVTTVEGIESKLDTITERYDLVITYDNLQGISIGKGTLKKWRKAHPDTRFILLMADEKKGRGKMAFFLNMNYYDAVFYSDFRVPYIMQLLERDRTKEEASAYYGIVYSEEAEHADSTSEVPVDDSKPATDLEVAKEGDGEEIIQEEEPQNVVAKTESLAASEPSLNPHLPDIDSRDVEMTLSEEIEDIPDDEIYMDDIYDDMEYTESSDDFEEEEPVAGKDAREGEVYTEMIFREITKSNPSFYNSWIQHMRTDTELEAYIKEQIDKFEIPQEYVGEVYDAIWSFFFGFDVLTPLLDDIEISDIHVTYTDRIFARRNGYLYLTDFHFRSDDHFRSFVNQFATKNNKIISDDDAIVYFTDMKHPLFYQRITLTTEYISATRLPYLCMRKTSKIKYTFDQLIGFKMMNEEIAAYIIEKVNEDYCIIISGKGGSGKSTLTNTCLDAIENDKVGLVLQENFELFTDRKDLCMMFENIMVDNNVKKADYLAAGKKEPQCQYDLQKLATMGLLQDLDYLIISETKSVEAMEVINLYYSGHRTWTTLHADHARHNLDKLVGLAMPGSLYSKEQLMQMVCTHAVCIHMSYFAIDEIVEACGWDEDKEQVIYKDIYIMSEEEKKQREKAAKKKFKKQEKKASKAS